MIAVLMLKLHFHSNRALFNQVLPVSIDEAMLDTDVVGLIIVVLLLHRLVLTMRIVILDKLSWRTSAWHVYKDHLIFVRFAKSLLIETHHEGSPQIHPQSSIPHLSN